MWLTFNIRAQGLLQDGYNPACITSPKGEDSIDAAKEEGAMWGTNLDGEGERVDEEIIQISLDA